MEDFVKYQMSEREFAHFIGKTKMFHHLNKDEQKELFPIGLSESQINHVVKDYYKCPNFSRNEDGSINFWNLYQLLTEANKSSYIDSNLERNLNTYELINYLGNSIKNNTPNWFIHK